MSSLDGANPEELDPVLEVPVLDLDAVSGPGPWDGFQGLDLAEPGLGVKVRAVVRKGKYICPI